MSVRAGRRKCRDSKEGCCEGRVFKAYGRDELNSNGKRLLAHVSDHKLALTNTFLSARKGGISQTLNGINRRNDQRQIDYTSQHAKHIDLACMSLRLTASLWPQPRRIQTIPSYSPWSASSGHFAPNRYVRAKNIFRPFDRQKLRSHGDYRQRAVARIISKLPFLPSQSNSISRDGRIFCRCYS